MKIDMSPNGKELRLETQNGADQFVIGRISQKLKLRTNPVHDHASYSSGTAQ